MSPSLIPARNFIPKVIRDPAYDNFPPPNQFGAPDKFDQWRQFQAQAAVSVFDCQARFIAQCMPTGSGKSVVNMMAALMPGKRMAYLTATKGLQTQLDADGWPGLVDIRGMGNYECVEAMPGGAFHDRTAVTALGEQRAVMCDEGPCTAGVQCGRRGGGCLYFDARNRAVGSQLVITNYSYWMHIHKYGEGLGQFDILILDEAHDAADELSKFVSVVINSLDMVLITGDPFIDPAKEMLEWREWAGYWIGLVAGRILALELEIKDKRSTFKRITRAEMHELRRLKTAQSKLAQLASATGEWVLEYRSGRQGRREVQFDPVWPQAYSEEYLFLDIKKVVLSSATIRPKTLEILGIPEDQAEFREYPSTFPTERRPVIHVATAAMSMKANDAMRREWHERMDQIIKWRTDRKGIIHTVSYDRATKIAAESQYRHLMMLNDTNSTRDTVAEFKRADYPCILVSPSVTTGYDFPYDECEYIIISKVPFPPPTSAIIKARTERDRYYSHYLAVLEMVQMAGRGMRAEDDQCEVIIVDDQVIAGWFIKSLKNFSPEWFMQSFRSQRTIPAPLPKLNRMVVAGR